MSEQRDLLEEAEIELREVREENARLREVIDRAIAMLKEACDTASLGGDVEYFQVDNALLVLQGKEPEDRNA